jgi:thymidylate synthase (FAD)
LRAELLSWTPLSRLRGALGEGFSAEELLPHVAFTFAVEGVSRACSHQLVRHRVASFSQQSQRYVPVRRLAERVVTPASFDEGELEVFRSLVEASSEAYVRLVERGVPREDARFVLPNAVGTDLLVTMDGGSLFHFFGLRCCSRAQWEIHDLADEMLAEARRAEPELFRGAGPYCYQLGRCPEGRFSCGRMREVAERYGGGL